MMFVPILSWQILGVLVHIQYDMSLLLVQVRDDGLTFPWDPSESFGAACSQPSLLNNVSALLAAWCGGPRPFSRFRFVLETESICQDRLGTDVGNVEKDTRLLQATRRRGRTRAVQPAGRCSQPIRTPLCGLASQRWRDRLPGAVSAAVCAALSRAVPGRADDSTLPLRIW